MATSVLQASLILTVSALERLYTTHQARFKVRRLASALKIVTRALQTAQSLGRAVSAKTMAYS